MERYFRQNDQNYDDAPNKSANQGKDRRSEISDLAGDAPVVATSYGLEVLETCKMYQNSKQSIDVIERTVFLRNLLRSANLETLSIAVSYVECMSLSKTR